MAELRALARASGAFAMVAIDQRESLRTLIAERTGVDRAAITEDALVDFKVEVARVLSPHASALLVDRDYGLEPTLAAAALAPGCGLIVAVDTLEQVAGGPVTDTTLDERADPEALRDAGAHALKLLVIWRDDADAERRLAMTRRFVRLAADAGLASVVEGVVRPTGDGAGWDRERAIVDAARRLGGSGPELYKAEVPFHGDADASAIADVASAITAALPCPWVVLSQGVDPARFPTSVEAACRGGASGFLAGRAIWTDAIRAAGDTRGALREISVPRLQSLGELVDSAALTRVAGEMDRK